MVLKQHDQPEGKQVSESLVAVNNSVKHIKTCGGLLTLTQLPAQYRSKHAYPLVLLHGWGNSSKVWQPLIPLLCREREVLLIDLPGCGENTYSADFSFEELMLGLEECLPQRCYLMGWSLGGMLATRLAAITPAKIQALVCLATNLCFVANDEWPWAMAPAVFQKFKRGFSQNPLVVYKRFVALQALGDQRRKKVLEQTERLNKAPQAGQVSSWNSLLSILSNINNITISKRISCPGLHLYASNDALVPSIVAEHAFRGVGQKVKVFTECGHAFLLSKTQDLATEINTFLTLLEHRKEHNEGKLRIAKAFGQVASRYDEAAKLQRRIARALTDMIAFELSLGARVLDLGCGTGFVGELLLKKQNEIFLMLTDLSQGMLSQAKSNISRLVEKPSEKPVFIAADMDALPLAKESVELVVSSMSMQWSTDTENLLAQVHANLRPGGYFLFATVGEATLNELASAWRQVDDYVHVNSFLPAPHLLRLATEQGFSCEQQCTERHVQYFVDVIDVMKSLKAIGAHTVNTGGNHGLTSRSRLQALRHAYEPFRNREKLLPVTWEIHYLLLRK